MPKSLDNTMRSVPKILRVTTVDLSLDKLLAGQLAFLHRHFELVGVSADTGKLAGVAQREGIRVEAVDMQREIAPLKDLISLWRLYRLFLRERPQIVHANTPKGSLLAMLAARFAKVPYRIYTVTGLRYQGATGFLRLVLKTMERVTCTAASHVIPEGQGVLHTLQQDGITHKPLQVLHHGNINGIDTAYYAPQKAAHEHPLFSFVFIGRITRDKGIHELVESVKHLPCLLTVVGSYEDGDSIDEEDKRWLQSSKRVRMVGWQDDVRPFIADADVVVFPSYREGFPNVPLQAGSMERACIVTDIIGCNEIIQDGVNGKIVPAHDAAALQEAMHWMMHHPAAVEKMGKVAREMVRQRFEQRDVWEALLCYYQSLLKTNKLQ